MKVTFKGIAIKLLALGFISWIALAWCVTSIVSVDIKGKNQTCVRQCTGAYSSQICHTIVMPIQSAYASGFKP